MVSTITVHRRYVRWFDAWTGPTPNVKSELTAVGAGDNYRLFTDEQYDAKARKAQAPAQPGETGLYYLRARYYDPEIGRFLTRDPLGVGNPYAYANNNPVTLIDPTGLTPESIGWINWCSREWVETLWKAGVDPKWIMVQQGGECLDQWYSGGIFVYGLDVAASFVWDQGRWVTGDAAQEAVQFLGSECAQGIAAVVITGASVYSGVGGVYVLYQSGGLVFGSAAAAGTSAAAAGAAFGPSNAQNIVSFAPSAYTGIIKCH